MKQLFAFSILFCLVFLNVPRSLVHNCEHSIDQNSESIHHHNNGNEEAVFDVDREHCFICEFDLGFFNVVYAKAPSFATFFNYTFNEPSVEYVNPDKFSAFSHRGPPAI